MRSLYRALGVSPSADEAQIKAAFRQLAKRSHPDLNAGDTESGERFRAIHQAYRLLRDPQTRAVVDFISAQARATTRRRRLTTVPTMVVTFVLTVCGGVLLLTWPPPLERQVAGHGEQKGPVERQVGDAQPPRGPAALSANAPAESPTRPPPVSAAALEKPSTEASLQPLPPPQKAPPADAATKSENSPPAPARQPFGDKVAILAPALVTAAPRGSRPDEWNVYQNVRFGFSLRYPAHVFAPVAIEGNDGVLFVSHDGRARLRISATRAGRVTTLPVFRRKLMEQEYGGAAFDRTPLHKTWFALSGRRGEEKFYERVTCSCDGKALHAWQLTYPLAERAFYEPIVDEIRRSYRREGEDGEGHCRRSQA